MNWLKREGLGGAVIWAIDLDDFLGLCGKRWPLLTAVRSSLLSNPFKISDNPAIFTPEPKPSQSIVNQEKTISPSDAMRMIFF